MQSVQRLHSTSVTSGMTAWLDLSLVFFEFVPSSYVFSRCPVNDARTSRTKRLVITVVDFYRSNVFLSLNQQCQRTEWKSKNWVYWSQYNTPADRQGDRCHFVASIVVVVVALQCLSGVVCLEWLARTQLVLRCQNCCHSAISIPLHSPASSAGSRQPIPGTSLHQLVPRLLTATIARWQDTELTVSLQLVPCLPVTLHQVYNQLLQREYISASSIIVLPLRTMHSADTL